MPGSSLLAPFTVIDQTYRVAFTTYLSNAVGSIERTVAAPLLACVTLWVIVQGILIMRGDIDVRRGLTKLISVALVVGLVTSADLYQQYVQSLFEDAIPAMVREAGGNMGLPTQGIPTELDIVFRGGEAAFQKVAASIPPMDELDALAFEGAQFFFFFTLWSIFGIYHVVTILTSVLVTVGPIFILGFLFEATQGMTTRWVGQLISYAILLLLTSIVITVVMTVMVAGMAAVFLVTIGAGTTAGQLIGLYELDLFIMTGNALVVALPGIAASIGGGVGASGTQLGQSIYRHFAGKPSQSTIQNMGFIQ